MRIFAITRNDRRDPPGYQSTWAYRELFHGNDSSKMSLYGERPYTAKRLVRNARTMPDVFMPNIFLVVSDAVSKQLSTVSLGAFDMNPCVWHKVFDHSMEEPEVIHLVERFRRFGGPDYEEWRDPLLRDPSFEEQEVQYQEVIAPLLSKVSSPDACSVELKLPDQPVYFRKPPVKTCAALHEAFPLLKVSSYFLCTEPIHSILEPHIQNPYVFHLRVFGVNGDAGNELLASARSGVA